MVKKYWLAITFAAGVALGVFIARPHPGMVRSVSVPKPVSSVPVEAVGAAEARVATTPAATQVPAKEKAEAAPAAAPAQAVSAPAGDDANSVPIDVGPVFREQFAEAQAHGLKNALLDLHQDLERETRNDAWAYAAEADIQNSLIADTGAGNFKVDHLECRATLCEVRLSARGKEQSEALNRWHQGMRAQPWGNQLEPRTSSMIGRNEDADVLVIFKRPEKKAPDRTTPEKLVRAS